MFLNEVMGENLPHVPQLVAEFDEHILVSLREVLVILFLDILETLIEQKKELQRLAGLLQQRNLKLFELVCF